MKAHKLRSGMAHTTVCGAVLSCGVHKTWPGVTCLSCLRSKPKPRVHYYAHENPCFTACMLNLNVVSVEDTDRWSEVTCINCRKSGGQKV